MRAANSSNRYTRKSGCAASGPPADYPLQFALANVALHDKDNVWVDIFCRPAFERPPVPLELAAYHVGVFGAAVNFEPIEKLMRLHAHLKIRIGGKRYAIDGAVRGRFGRIRNDGQSPLALQALELHKALGNRQGVQVNHPQRSVAAALAEISPANPSELVDIRPRPTAKAAHHARQPDEVPGIRQPLQSSIERSFRGLFRKRQLAQLPSRQQPKASNQLDDLELTRSERCSHRPPRRNGVTATGQRPRSSPLRLWADTHSDAHSPMTGFYPPWTACMPRARSKET